MHCPLLRCLWSMKQKCFIIPSRERQQWQIRFWIISTIKHFSLGKSFIFMLLLFRIQFFVCIYKKWGFENWKKGELKLKSSNMTKPNMKSDTRYVIICICINNGTPKVLVSSSESWYKGDSYETFKPFGVPLLMKI